MAFKELPKKNCRTSGIFREPEGVTIEVVESSRAKRLVFGHEVAASRVKLLPWAVFTWARRVLVGH